MMLTKKNNTLIKINTKKIIALLFVIMLHKRAISGEGLDLSNQEYLPYLQTGSMRSFNPRGGDIAVSTDLFLPIWQRTNKLLFVDARIFDRPGKTFEGNLHLGYRYLFPESQQLFGIYGAFDRKQTEKGTHFNQLTLGFEYWLKQFFTGGNIYLPIGKTEKLLGYTETAKLKRNGIYRNVYITFDGYYEKATPGVDMEMGYEPIKNLTLYGGWYYFASSQVKTTSGPRARLTYDFSLENERKVLGVLDKIGFEVGIQKDQTRGTTYYIGANIKIGGIFAKKTELPGVMRHMTDLIRRDVDIITSDFINKDEKEDDTKYAIVDVDNLTEVVNTKKEQITQQIQADYEFARKVQEQYDNERLDSYCTENCTPFENYNNNKNITPSNIEDRVSYNNYNDPYTTIFTTLLPEGWYRGDEGTGKQYRVLNPAQKKHLLEIKSSSGKIHSIIIDSPTNTKSPLPRINYIKGNKSLLTKKPESFNPSEETVKILRQEIETKTNEIKLLQKANKKEQDSYNNTKQKLKEAEDSIQQKDLEMQTLSTDFAFYKESTQKELKRLSESEKNISLPHSEVSLQENEIKSLQEIPDVEENLNDDAKLNPIKSGQDIYQINPNIFRKKRNVSQAWGENEIVTNYHIDDSSRESIDIEIKQLQQEIKVIEQEKSIDDSFTEQQIIEDEKNRTQQYQTLSLNENTHNDIGQKNIESEEDKILRQMQVVEELILERSNNKNMTEILNGDLSLLKNYIQLSGEQIDKNIEYKDNIQKESEQLVENRKTINLLQQELVSKEEAIKSLQQQVPMIELKAKQKQIAEVKKYKDSLIEKEQTVKTLTETIEKNQDHYNRLLEQNNKEIMLKEKEAASLKLEINNIKEKFKLLPQQGTIINGLPNQDTQIIAAKENEIKSLQDKLSENNQSKEELLQKNKVLMDRIRELESKIKQATIVSSQEIGDLFKNLEQKSTLLLGGDDKKQMRKECEDIANVIKSLDKTNEEAKDKFKKLMTSLQDKIGNDLSIYEYHEIKIDDEVTDKSLVKKELQYISQIQYAKLYAEWEKTNNEAIELVINYERSDSKTQQKLEEQNKKFAERLAKEQADNNNLLNIKTESNNNEKNKIKEKTRRKELAGNKYGELLKSLEQIKTDFNQGQGNNNFKQSDIQEALEKCLKVKRALGEIEARQESLQNIIDSGKSIKTKLEDNLILQNKLQEEASKEKERSQKILEQRKQWIVDSKIAVAEIEKWSDKEKTISDNKKKKIPLRELLYNTISDNKYLEALFNPNKKLKSDDILLTSSSMYKEELVAVRGYLIEQHDQLTTRKSPQDKNNLQTINEIISSLNSKIDVAKSIIKNTTTNIPLAPTLNFPGLNVINVIPQVPVLNLPGLNKTSDIKPPILNLPGFNITNNLSINKEAKIILKEEVVNFSGENTVLLSE